MPPPNVSVSWWQIGFLAGVGLFVNLPATIGWELLPNSFHEIEIYWLFSAVYLLGMYFLFRKLLFLINNNEET